MLQSLPANSIRLSNKHSDTRGKTSSTGTLKFTRLIRKPPRVGVICRLHDSSKAFTEYRFPITSLEADKGKACEPVTTWQHLILQIAGFGHQSAATGMGPSIHNGVVDNPITMNLAAGKSTINAGGSSKFEDALCPVLMFVDTQRGHPMNHAERSKSLLYMVWRAKRKAGRDSWLVCSH